jgi:hypothetical protein
LPVVRLRRALPMDEVADWKESASPLRVKSL